MFNTQLLEKMLGRGLQTTSAGMMGQPMPGQPQEQTFQTPPVQGAPMPGPAQPNKMGLLQRILQGGAAGMQGYGQASMGARLK